MRSMRATRHRGGVEWINPISLSNQPEQKPADGAELLKGLQLSQAAFLVKVMLLDLSEEAALIDEEHERLVSDHHDTERSGIEGFFNLFASLDEDEKKVNMDKVAAAEKAGDMEKANRLREMFLMTPFQIAHDIINEILIPQIDSLLACFSELTQGDTM